MQEIYRLRKMSLYEKQLKAEGFLRVAGLDEAGRGPLAGPVVAAACILPEGIFWEGINDSKQLTAEERRVLFEKIIPSATYAIGIVDVETIDRINILQATLLAMRNAIASLPIEPDYLLVDGNQLPTLKIPSKAIVAGDCLSVSIAAASILAKVTRDRIMEQLDLEWPQYGFKQHKGYATEQHLLAIEQHGPCPIHRKSFDPIRSTLNSQLTLLQSL